MVAQLKPKQIDLMKSDLLTVRIAWILGSVTRLGYI